MSTELLVKPIRKLLVTTGIKSTSPMIQHRWSEKALQMMRDKHAGKKTKNRDVRNPEKEGRDAAYLTDDDRYGVPAMAVKSAVLSAAHKDLGVPRTMVMKSLFLVCSDKNMVIPFKDYSEPHIREDAVTVGSSSTDLRYRPQFDTWSTVVQWELDSELLQVGDLVNLISRAGFGVGVGEWRPEKGGEYGRFEIDSTIPVAAEEV